jgi:hypothetical protein
MNYWNTSAPIKLYVAEVDSPYFPQLLGNSDEPNISLAIVATEGLCVRYRKE